MALGWSCWSAIRISVEEAEEFGKTRLRM